MKKLLIILGLAIASGCMTLTPSIAAVRDAGYISVNATETREITPNTATVVFGVETTDIDSKRAVERNNQICTKVIAGLKSELLSDKKSTVQTKNFNLRPNYKYTNNDVKTIKNYTAINSVEVKTTDISKLSHLIDIAVKNNVSNVNSVNFSLDDDETYSTELINAAVSKARAVAKNTAAAANQKLGGIKSLRVNVYQQTSNGARLYKTYASAMGTESASMDTSTPVESGKIKLNASVDAEFYVK